jgi:hypothetical protein
MERSGDAGQPMRDEELLSGGLTIELKTDSAEVFHLRPVEE